MAFTKVVGPGIHTLAQLRTHNIHSAGIITATKFVGEMESGGGDSTFQNVTVNGNLTVQGDTTTLNTTLRNVELLRVAANSNTTAGIITQTGTGDILNLFDATTEVMTVVDGGKVGIGDTDPATKLEVNSATGTRIRSSYTNTGGSRDAGFDIWADDSGTFAARASLVHSGSGGLTSLYAQNQFKLYSDQSDPTIFATRAGKVGINTSTPAQQFTSYAASGYPILANGTSNGIGLGGNGAIVFGTNNLAAYAKGILDATELEIKVSGTPKLLIDSSGDLRIGNTTQTFLDAARNLVVGGGSGSEGITIYSGASDGGFIAFADGTSDPAYRMGQIIYDHSGNEMLFRTNGNTNRLIIKSGGEVRIGADSTTASTAGDDLVIEGSSDRGLSIISGTSSSANIYFGDSSDADVGRIAYQHNDNALDFSTNAGSTALRITSTGKVFIGSASDNGPGAYNLANNGLIITAAGENALKVLDSTSYAADVGGAILMGGNYRSSNDTQAFVELKSFKENGTDANYAYGFRIGTSANGQNITERLRITSSGQILIGPGAVASTKCSVGGLDISSGLLSLIVGGEANTGDGTPRTNSVTKECRIGVPHYTLAEEPTAAIVAFNQSGDNYLRLGGGTSLLNACSDFAVYTAANTTTTSGTQRFHINENGHARFGTGTAVYNLEVRDSGAVEFLVGSIDAGSASIILDGDGNGDGSGSDYAQIWHDTSGNLNYRARGASSSHTSHVFHTNTTERLRVNSDGRLFLGSSLNSNADTYKMSIKESSSENAAIMFLDTDNMKGGLCGISKGNNELISGTTNVDFVVGSLYADTHIIASPANVSNTVIAMTVEHNRIKLWENTLISNNVVHTGNTNSNVIVERLQILPSENDGYDDSHILSAVQTAGNWEQGAGTSNYDTSWGWIWQYAGNASSTKEVRAGIAYDHKGSEEFKYWSSYGCHAFYVDGGKSGNETAETCSDRAMVINHDGAVHIGDSLKNNHAGRFQVIHEGGGNQAGDTLSFFETNANDWCITTNSNESGNAAHHHLYFYEEGSGRGSISGSNGSNVNYNQGSDYRLKENIVEMTGTEGIDICKKLKPSKYNWIKNREGTGQINTVDGFIAHEVAEAGVLGAVTGEKDALKDGKIDPQMLDYGQMTPVLAAAIKGLIAKVETLETKVASLESS